MTKTQTKESPMAIATEMTAGDFLKVRGAVAELIRSKQPRSEQTERQAEALMEKGWIDVAQVIEDLQPKPATGGRVPPVPGTSAAMVSAAGVR